MKAHLVTLGLLSAAFVLSVLFPPPDDAQAIAESLLGPAARLDLPGPPSFQAGDRTLLFFEGRGMRGPIRGVIVIEGDRIRELRVLHSKEGFHANELEDPSYLGSFRGKQAPAPVVVQAVSGATISSQALIDAVNERLSAWEHWRKENEEGT